MFLGPGLPLRCQRDSTGVFRAASSLSSASVFPLLHLLPGDLLGRLRCSRLPLVPDLVPSKIDRSHHVLIHGRRTDLSGLLRSRRDAFRRRYWRPRLRRLPVGRMLRQGLRQLSCADLGSHLRRILRETRLGQRHGAVTRGDRWASHGSPDLRGNPALGSLWPSLGLCAALLDPWLWTTHRRLHRLRSLRSVDSQLSLAPSLPYPSGL